MGQRRDKADLLAGLFQPDIPGRAARILSQIGDGVMFLVGAAHILERPILAQAVLVAQVAHGHHLDPGQINPAIRTPCGHRRQFCLVEAFQRDGVDLDPQPGILRRVDPAQHLRQTSPTGDVGEFLIVQRIKRDIHTAHARSIKIGGIAFQLAAIGGQRQLFQRAGVQMAGHAVEEGHDTLADQRLTAGDAQLLHTQIDKVGAQPIQLFQSQKFLLGEEIHILGHAINTAEVTAVCDRDAQIGDSAGERVNQRCIHIP